jgi:hypothetical protein
MHVGDTFIVDEQGHFVSDVSSEKFIPSPQAPEAAALEPAPEVSSPEVVPELAAEPVVAPMPELISATDHDIETYPTPPPIETMSVTDIFTTSSEVLPAISADQRLGLLNLIKMHGVGPGEGETVADFTARVENAPLIGKIVSGYRGLQVPLGETHIYRNVHDHLVVFGGDTSAQATVMVEYLRAHPGQSVFQGSVGNDGVSHLLPYQLSNNKLIVSGLGVREPSWLERRLGFSGSLAEGPKPGDLKATVF